MPAASLSDLNKGDAVMIVGHIWNAGRRSNAITLLAGVDQFSKPHPTAVNPYFPLESQLTGGDREPIFAGAANHVGISGALMTFGCAQKIVRHRVMLSAGLLSRCSSRPWSARSNG